MLLGSNADKTEVPVFIKILSIKEKTTENRGSIMENKQESFYRINLVSLKKMKMKIINFMKLTIVVIRKCIYLMLLNLLLNPGKDIIWICKQEIKVNATLEIHDLIEIENWASSYIPKKSGVNYDSVLKYAERQHDQLIKMIDVLDNKAEALMKFAATIGAVLSALVQLLKDNPIFDLISIKISLVFYLLSMLLCIIVRMPSKTIIPMSVKTLIDVAEGVNINQCDQFSSKQEPPSNTEVDAIMAASYYYASMGLKNNIIIKAKMLSIATCVFSYGIVITVLSLIFS